MNIIALDLSLTRTGWCSLNGPGFLVPPKDSDRGMPRLAWIRKQVLELTTFRQLPADLVVVEGYSFGSKGRATYGIAELGGVVRLALHDAGVPYVEVSPAALKKYATGKGNAGKELVLVEAVKRLGYTGSDNNEADALWLWTMARDQYGLDEPVVPKAHREALVKVQWPAIAKAAAA